MTLEQFIIQLVLPLSTSGVIGYFTYFVLNRMGTSFFTNEKSDDKKNWYIFFGVINVLIVYVLYIYVYPDYLVSIGLGILFSIVLAIWIYPRLFNMLYKYVNKRREKAGLSPFVGKSDVWSSLADKAQPIAVYVYDLKTNELLAYGGLGENGGEGNYFDFAIIPYEHLEPWSYEEGIRRSYINEGSEIYINADKGLKILFIPTSDEDEEVADNS